MDLFQWKRFTDVDPWIFSIEKHLWIFSIEKDPWMETSGFNSLFHSVDAMISSLSNPTLNGDNGELHRGILAHSMVERYLDITLSYYQIVVAMHRQRDVSVHALLVVCCN